MKAAYQTAINVICRALACLVRVIPVRLRQDQAGTVAIEFAIVALPFFTMIFAIIQLAMLLLTQQLLQTAVADTARLIRTGQAKTAGWTISNYNTQVCSELYGMLDCTALQSYVTAYTTPTAISTSAPAVDKNGAYSSSASYDSNANSGATIVVAATYYQYPSLFAGLGLSVADQPNGTHLIGAVAAFRNEPFP
jgi:Flp pilus assembly protein TadG